MGRHSLHTVKRIFGTWRNAIIEVFGEDPLTRKLSRQQVPCAHCGTHTSNQRFCSRKCSTAFLNNNENGRIHGRRQSKTVLCVVCRNEFSANQRKRRCPACADNTIKTSDGTFVSIKIATKKMVLTHDTQKYRRIRLHARKTAKEHSLLERCVVCGYSSHVECCHRKSIESFRGEELLSEINAPSNLAGLCPNHHWEFDNGLLKL